MAKTYSLRPSVADDGFGLPVVSFFGHEALLGMAELRTVRIIEDGAGNPVIEMNAPWTLREPSRGWLPPLAAVMVFIELGQAGRKEGGMIGADDKAARGSSLLRTAGLALAIGFGVAGLLMGVVDGGRSSIFTNSGAYVGFTLMFALIALPVLLIRRLFERGPSGTWPRWKTFEPTTNALGLPVVRWREWSMFLPPRQLGVFQDETGVWQLVFIRPKVVQARGGFSDLMFGLAGPIARGVAEMAKHGGEAQVRPWATLSTLEVLPWKQLHGGVGPFTHNRREQSNVLLAWFDDGTSIELSDWWWSRDALASLSNMIRREFIERRTEHLQRASAAARRAQNGEGTEKAKVI